MRGRRERGRRRGRDERAREQCAHSQEQARRARLAGMPPTFTPLLGLALGLAMACTTAPRARVPEPVPDKLVLLDGGYRVVALRDVARHLPPERRPAAPHAVPR